MTPVLDSSRVMVPSGWVAGAVCAATPAADRMARPAQARTGLRARIAMTLHLSPPSDDPCGLWECPCSNFNAAARRLTSRRIRRIALPNLRIFGGRGSAGGAGAPLAFLQTSQVPGLGLVSDVPQDPHVDAVDDRVRPKGPVGRRPHVVAVPGRALEARATAWQWRQPELAPLGGEEPLEVGRVHVLVRRSEEHTSELQSLRHLVCRLLL